MDIFQDMYFSPHYTPKIIATDILMNVFYMLYQLDTVWFNNYLLVIFLLVHISLHTKTAEG